MLTTLTVVTPPAEEPVTLAQISSHLRIDTTDDQDLLVMYGTSARMMVEAYLSRTLITTEFLWVAAPEKFSRWRSVRRFDSPLELPRSPVQTVNSVILRDILGNDTTLDPSTYVVDADLNPAQLRLLYWTEQIPVCTPIEHIRVNFDAGYGTDATNIPMPIINSILVTAAFLYENRGDQGGDIPMAAQWLLDPYRVQYFGG